MPNANDRHRGAGVSNDMQLWETRNGIRSLKKEQEIKESSRLYLSVQGHTDTYSFYYGYEEQEMLPLVLCADGVLLSSDVNNGFTGTYLGMYASANHRDSLAFADFDWFTYQGE